MQLYNPGIYSPLHTSQIDTGSAPWIADWNSHLSATHEKGGDIQNRESRINDYSLKVLTLLAANYSWWLIQEVTAIKKASRGSLMASTRRWQVSSGDIDCINLPWLLVLFCSQVSAYLFLSSHSLVAQWHRNTAAFRCLNFNVLITLPLLPLLIWLGLRDRARSSGLLSRQGAREVQWQVIRTPKHSPCLASSFLNVWGQIYTLLQFATGYTKQEN